MPVWSRAAKPPHRPAPVPVATQDDYTFSLAGPPIPAPLCRLDKGFAYLGEQRGLTSTAWGDMIFINTQDISLAPWLIHWGLWEPDTSKALLAVTPLGATVLEVGANYGYYTLLAGRAVGPEGQVHAFEANPKTFELLWQSVKISVMAGRITIDPRAAYRTSGETLQFSQYTRFLGGSHLGATDSARLQEDQHDQPIYIDVKTVSLDDYCAEKRLTPNVIKIDAEGAETHVFAGMERIIHESKDLAIVSEFCPQMFRNGGFDPEKMLRDFVNLGYRIGYCTRNGIEGITINDLLAEETRLVDIVLKRG